MGGRTSVKPPDSVWLRRGRNLSGPDRQHREKPLVANTRGAHTFEGRIEMRLGNRGVRLKPWGGEGGTGILPVTGATSYQPVLRHSPFLTFTRVRLSWP